MVDVLLISIGFDNNERYRIYSLSLGVLKASILHHFPNLKVHTIDAYDRKMSESEIVETVIGLNPHIVGFSSTTFYYQQIHRMFSEIARQNPYIWRVLGGYISLLENCLSLTHADIVVKGEGDYTIADLCRTMFKFSKNRAIQRMEKPDINEEILSQIQGIYYRWPLMGPTFEIKFTGHRPLVDNLDALPTPDFDDVMQNTTSEEFAFALYCQRGCYNNCSFCDILHFFGRVGIRSMSPKRIIEHIKILREKYDAREISLVDDNFMSSRTFLEGFISEFEAAGLIGKVMIDFQSRANDIIRYRDLLEKMIPFVAGVQIGIESFVDSQLRRYNKHITADQNMEALQILSDLKISYLAYYILLDPNVSLEEIEENIEKLKKAPPVPVKRHKFLLPHLIAQTEFEIELDVWGKMRISGIPHLEAFNDFMEQTEDKMKEIEKIYQSLKIAEVYNDSETLANSIALSSAKLFFTIAEQIAEERLDMALEVCEKIYYRRFFKHRYKRAVDKQVKKFNEQVESLLRVVRLTGLPVEEILGLIENEE